jgi:hypothetical protein
MIVMPLRRRNPGFRELFPIGKRGRSVANYFYSLVTMVERLRVAGMATGTKAANFLLAALRMARRQRRIAARRRISRCGSASARGQAAAHVGPFVEADRRMPWEVESLAPAL